MTYLKLFLAQIREQFRTKKKAADAPNPVKPSPTCKHCGGDGYILIGLGDIEPCRHC